MSADARKEVVMAHVTSPRRVIPRSRGALTGVLIVVLGIWGGLMPYLGSAFDYTYTPDDTWTWTEGRFWLQLLPAIAAVVGGLALLFSRSRAAAMAGGWLAAAAGGWFVVGPLLSPLWDSTFLGTPVGDKTDRAVEQIGLFFGLGAAIILFAAFAVGRLSIIGVRDQELAERYAERARERETAAAQRTIDEQAAAEQAAADQAAAHHAAAANQGAAEAERDEAARRSPI